MKEIKKKKKYKKKSRDEGKNDRKDASHINGRVDLLWVNNGYTQQVQYAANRN